MKRREYAYNDVYRAVNKVTTQLKYFDLEYDVEKDNYDENTLFKDYVLFITVFKYIDSQISKLHRSKDKESLLKRSRIAQLIDTVEQKYKLTTDTKPKLLMSKILLEMFISKTNYFDTLKYEIFPQDMQIDIDKLEFDLYHLISMSTDKDTKENFDGFVDATSSVKSSFDTFASNIIRILSVKDTDELIEIYMTIYQSNKNEYYITHSYKTQVLTTFISDYVKTEQNLVCLGKSPHTQYESYHNCFYGRKDLSLKNTDGLNEVYFGWQNSYYAELFPLLLKLKSQLPKIEVFDGAVFNEDKDTLVIAIDDEEFRLEETTENNGSNQDYFPIYNTALNQTTTKAFITMAYSKIYGSHRDNIDMQEQLKFIIENQHIEKIISFPNNYFSHTSEPQVLLEISKEKVDGIHFIDLAKLPKPIVQMHKDKTFNIKHLQELSQWYKHEDLSIRDTLVSKWVSYADIKEKHQYNITTNYHLTELDASKEENRLDNCFDIKKLQRFNSFKGLDTLKVFAISDFNEFGFTTSEDINKKILFEAPISTMKIEEYEKKNSNNELSKEESKKLTQYRKFQSSHQLREYDILIYVDNPKIITIVGSVRPYTIASHNLIRFRVNEENIEDIQKLSKSLYLFLLSDIGQASLEKIVVKSKIGKDVLSINLLDTIDFDHTIDRSDKFDKLQQEQQKIDKIKKGILKKIKEF